MTHAQNRGPAVTDGDGGRASSPATGPFRRAWCTVTGWPSRSAPAALAAGFMAAFLLIRAWRDDLPDTRAAS